MTQLAPYAGSPRTADRRSLTPGYQRWMRACWIARYGGKTSGKAWQPHEDERALEMRSRFKSYGQIAIRLQRTPDAVAARLRLLRTTG